MDPKEVRLNTAQKIGPLIRAINHEIPWQFVLIMGITLYCAIYGGGTIPVFIESSIGDFIVRRIILGATIGIISFIIQGLTYFFIEEQLIPLVSKIKNNYEAESLQTKKELLDRVIEDEILR